MYLVLTLMVQFLIKLGQALISCSEKNVTQLQLCSVENFGEENEYHNLYGYPDIKSVGDPMLVNTALTLISIAEFNDEQSTILLNVILSLDWNDTRISMIPKK